MSNTTKKSEPTITARPQRAVPKPEPIQLGDPLRVETYNLPPDRAEVLRGQLMARIVDALGEASVLTLQHVAQCIDILNSEHGCTTPTEQFFVGLIRAQYADYGPVTPELVEHALDEYRGEFKDAIKEANEFNTRYARFLNHQKTGDSEVADVR